MNVCHLLIKGKIHEFKVYEFQLIKSQTTFYFQVWKLIEEGNKKDKEFKKLSL